MNFKYGYLKQGVKTARKLLGCLAEYLTIASQMLIKTNGKLRMEMMNNMRASSSATSNYTDYEIQEFHESYGTKAQAYREMLVNLQNTFNYNTHPIRSMDLFHQFKEAYSGN